MDDAVRRGFCGKLIVNLEIFQERLITRDTHRAGDLVYLKAYPCMNPSQHAKETPTMCKVTLDLISPSSVPITLEVNNGDEQQTIIDMVDRAKRSDLLRQQRLALCPSRAHRPQCQRVGPGSDLRRLQCSPTVNEHGLPRGSSSTASRRNAAKNRATSGTASSQPMGPTNRCCASPKARQYRM